MIINYLVAKSLKLTSAEGIYRSILEGKQSVKLAKKIILQKLSAVSEKDPKAAAEILHAQLKLFDALEDVIKVCRKYNL